MKAVGECVCLVADGLSAPRDSSAPPTTVASGRTALIASYDDASSCSYATAATSAPNASNCGNQYRLEFGSFPMMNVFTCGSAAATAPANAVNCAWRSAVAGVLLEPVL